MKITLYQIHALKIKDKKYSPFTSAFTEAPPQNALKPPKFRSSHDCIAAINPVL